jgi:hypothetical protein
MIRTAIIYTVLGKATSGYHDAKMQANIFIFWFTNAKEGTSQLDKILHVILRL